MILSGISVAQRIEAFCNSVHQDYRQTYNESASLGILSIGDDPASQVYIAQKKKLAHRLGMECEEYSLPAHSKKEEVLAIIKKTAEKVHGLILQLPLPLGHDTETYLAAIPPEKDIDGLNPLFYPSFTPCTPLGCLWLLKAYHIPLQGIHALVIGRSRLVGRPLAALLTCHNATVTLAHRFTHNLHDFISHADIICVATGQHHLLNAAYTFKKDTVLLDVGIHRTPNGLQGDIHPDVYNHVAHYSPVPGGVGPMTVVALMWNTLQAALGHHKKKMPSFPWDS